jgi:transcription termination factor NusB
MAGRRHKARTIALQALYEVDAVGRKPEAVTERLLGAGTRHDQEQGRNRPEYS